MGERQLERLRVMGPRLLVGVLLLFGAGCGGPEATKSSPTTPETSPAGSASSTGDPITLGYVDFRLARDALVLADTFRYSLDTSDSSTDQRLGVAEVSGRYEFSTKLGSTHLVTMAGAEAITFNTVIAGDFGYSQNFVRGSTRAPHCWRRTTFSDGSGNVTLPRAIRVLVVARSVGSESGVSFPLTDVLVSIGLTQLASNLANEIGDQWVPVTPDIEREALTGWAVTNADLITSLKKLGAESGALDGAIDAFERSPDASWHIRFTHLGDPVTIKTPAADQLLGASRQRCSS